MSVGDTPDVLITIPISHFCEKARWALDRAGLSYVERPHLQVFHWAAVRRAGGGKTAPVLVRGDRVLADSADIVEEASAEAPPERRLFPDDPGAAAEVRDLQLDFDTNLGPHGRRWMYYGLRDRRDIAIDYACTGVPAWQRRALPVVYPVASPGDQSGPRDHAFHGGAVRGRGPPDLRRGRRATGRRAAVPLRRALHRRRPDLFRTRRLGSDAARVRRAAAAAGGASRADGGDGARVSRPPRRRPRDGDVPQRAAARPPPRAKILKRARRRQLTATSGLRAEREGFEPSRELAPPTRLAGECLQPLGHLSGPRNLSGAPSARGG